MSVLFFVALWPRLTAVNRYVTPDELIWVFRSVQFREALLNSQWENSLTAGHPGVITTWLGSLGIQLQLWLRPADTAVYEWITHLAWFAPDNDAMFRQLAVFLNSGRLLTAVVNSLGVVLIFQLSRALFGLLPALLAGLLLALDPFVAGLSGLLHVDGLMSTFAMIALLALGLALRHRDHVSYRFVAGFPVLSGFFAGLAVLTKSPALLLLPLTAVFLFLSLFQNRERPLAGRLTRAFGQGVAWLGSSLLTCWLLFPALWAGPVAVWAKMSSTSNRHIEEALRPTFFLGQTSFAPGPLFYPVTLSFRLSPVVLAGGLLALCLGLRAFVKRQDQTPWSRLPTWIFPAWAVLFLLAISLAAKKFDRYALPVILPLILWAALGWTTLPFTRARLAKRLVPLLLVIQALFLLWFLPYPLTAVNLLLGGPGVAQNVMDVGWGEAISQAGHWLAARPGVADQTAVSSMAPALAPFFPGKTVPAESGSRQADYIITPADGPGLELAGEGAVLLHTIRLNGRDQARIYQQVDPEPALDAQPLSSRLTFGQAVQLLGAAAAGPEALTVAVRWQLVLPTASRYTVKLALQDEQGIVWAGSEQPLLNDVYFYPEHWPDGETPLVRYRLPLPAGLPPGRYTVALSLFAADGSQLPLLDGDGRLRGLSYQLDGLPLQPAPVTNAANLSLSQPQAATWFDGGLRLLGQEPLPETVLTGDRAIVILVWQAQRPLPADLRLQFTAGGEALAQLPLSRFASEAWQPGQIIREAYPLPVPPDWGDGEYALAVRPLAAAEPAADLGLLSVRALARDAPMPEEHGLEAPVRFGDGLALQGMDLPQAAFAPGHTLALTLYWLVEERPSDLYTGFVHLIGPDGQTVAQSDQWPGGLPTTLRLPGESIWDQVVIELPPDLPAGEYRLGVGLYNAANGLRLPVLQPSPAPDDRLILPETVTITP